MLIKSALLDWLSMSYWYDKHSANWLAALASPFPASPDFPCLGGRIGRSMLSCRDMAPWLSIHSPTTKWGKGGGASHQRGNAFPTPAGRLYGFPMGESPIVKVLYKRAPSINVRRPPQPSAAEPLSNLRTLGAIAPSNFRTFKPTGLVHKPPAIYDLWLLLWPGGRRVRYTWYPHGL